MNGYYMISASSENTIRVLQRVTGIFAKHRVNIVSLDCTNSRNNTYDLSIVVNSNERIVQKLVNQMQNIIELIEINVWSQLPMERHTADRVDLNVSESLEVS